MAIYGPRLPQESQTLYNWDQSSLEVRLFQAVGLAQDVRSAEKFQCSLKYFLEDTQASPSRKKGCSGNGAEGFEHRSHGQMDTPHWIFQLKELSCDIGCQGHFWDVSQREQNKPLPCSAAISETQI